MSDRFIPVSSPTGGGSPAPSQRFVPVSGGQLGSGSSMGGGSGNATMSGIQSLLGGLKAGAGGLGSLNSAFNLGMDPSTLNTIGAGLGGLTSLFGLYKGAQSGNPGTLAGSALGAYSAASTLTNGALPAISGTVLGALAVPIAALTSYFSNEDVLNTANSGRVNNPVKGGLYSASTAGTQSAQQILDRIQAAGGPGAVPTDDLLQSLGPLFNGLRPYYDTAQGGRGGIRASDTVTGGTGDSKSKPYGGDSPEAYTARFTQAQQGTAQVLQSLLDRGVSYETIGKIPLQGNWASQMLDAADPLDTVYQRALGTPGIADQGAALMNRLYGEASGTPITDDAGSPTGRMSYLYDGKALPAGLPLEALFGGAQGSDRFTPSQQPGGGNVAAMYGGPIWNALARMGPAAGGQGIQDLIQRNFNPWVGIANAQGSELFNDLSTYQQPLGYFDRPETYNSGGGD